jgi:hypothetical protein
VAQNQIQESEHLIVCRNIHDFTVKAPSKIQEDNMVSHAVSSFGFLLGMRESLTFKEFSDLIVGYSSSRQAKCVADHLRSLTAE